MFFARDLRGGETYLLNNHRIVAIPNWKGLARSKEGESGFVLR